jgi:LuxR family transcriptional regulator, maltose regulon positive regulatory protein
LTNRELVILERLVKRLTYREIAEDLTISPETVKSHATSIYRKLKVSGRLQVIDTAQKMGFFSEKNN